MPGRPDCICKHCPAVGDVCAGCDGDGCPACNGEGAVLIQNPLLTAARKLLDLMDEVPIDPNLGDETDRVFARWEFAALRMAVDAEEGT